MHDRSQDEMFALIARYFSGTSDPEDNALLNEWIHNSPENRLYYEQVSTIWNLSEIKIDPEKIDTAGALEEIHTKIFKRSRASLMWIYWQKIAAFIVIPLVIGTLLVVMNKPAAVYSNEIVYNEIFTAFGTRTSLRLADSTLVWLNSGSSLKYPTKFEGKERKVFLNGEGYFEVESDASRPFIVQTSTLSVEARGTKFDVSEYNQQSDIEVTLVEGKVSVKRNTDRNPKLISDLNPGEHLKYNPATEEKILTIEDTYLHTAWINGKLIFRNETLGTVLNKLSAIFNVDIEVVGKELAENTYRATFEEESLEEMLKLLRLIAPIDYYETEREPLKDGSFPRRKIIVYPVNRKAK